MFSNYLYFDLECFLPLLSKICPHIINYLIYLCSACRYLRIFYYKPPDGKTLAQKTGKINIAFHPGCKYYPVTIFTKNLQLFCPNKQWKYIDINLICYYPLSKHI